MALFFEKDLNHSPRRGAQRVFSAKFDTGRRIESSNSSFFDSGIRAPLAGARHVMGPRNCVCLLPQHLTLAVKHRAGRLAFDSMERTMAAQALKSRVIVMLKATYIDNGLAMVLIHQRQDIRESPP